MAGGAPALADHRANHSVTFTAHGTDPGTRITGLHSCDPAQPGVCSCEFSGKGDWVQGLIGTDSYYGHIGYDPLAMSMTGESRDTSTAFLRGCGKGIFTIHQYDFHTSPIVFDPMTESGPMSYKWTVVSGSGAFAGATGSGTASGALYPPTAASFRGIPNDFICTGTIVCPHGN